MNSESEDEFPSRLEDMETDESAGTNANYELFNKLSSLSYQLQNHKNEGGGGPGLNVIMTLI